MGAGYRVIGRIQNPEKLGGKYQRLRIMYLYYSLPLPLWLGRGRYVNPYIAGHLLWMLIERLRPRAFGAS